MVPVAFATQTTGSIIRPAAFCGVVGYKPSYGTLPCAGVKAISESFDTVGVMVRTVADAALVVGTLSGRSLEPPAGSRAPRLGICLTHEWPAAQPETVALFESLPRLLERAAARPAPVELPEVFAGLVEAQGTVWTFEIARCLADEHLRFRERIREPLRGMLDDGAAMPIAEYDEALLRVRECGAAFPALVDGLDASRSCGSGRGARCATTGDPVFNRLVALGAASRFPPVPAPAVCRSACSSWAGRRGARVLACAAFLEMF
jgi:Asp-tRNA(Asn)/Glu-tRNA(Gln) amidotransferase A subunit family amidase